MPDGVRPHGQVDEPLELGEADDLVHPLAHVRPRQPVDGAVQEDVLAAGEVRVEARAELEQRADRPADLDPAARRPEDPGDQAQQRRLARAVPPDETDRLAGLDLEATRRGAPRCPSGAGARARTIASLSVTWRFG